MDRRSGLLQYVTSSDFAVDVAENWQSEYLQFLLFILAHRLVSCSAARRSPRARTRSAWSRTRTRWSAVTPSPDSPALGARPAGCGSGSSPAPSALVMAADLLAVLAGAVGRRLSAFNEQQLQPSCRIPSRWPAVSGLAGLLEPHAAELAVRVPRGRPAWPCCRIYLRERGSPESKPVGHRARRDRRGGLSGQRVVARAAHGPVVHTSAAVAARGPTWRLLVRPTAACRPTAAAWCSLGCQSAGDGALCTDPSTAAATSRSLTLRCWRPS